MDVLLLCIGNREGGDDGVGPYIADTFPKDIPDIVAIDCGSNPENYTSVVKRYHPNMMVLIDAVEMGLSPGEIRLVPEKRIGTMHVSTHGIPLSVIIRYLKAFLLQVILIGIQPKTMHGPLTTEVKQSANALITMIINKTFGVIETL
jgi:hydrogenase 3 maturation protease